MKKIIAFTTCIFLSGTLFAQKSATTKNDPAAAQRKLVASGKCAISGTVRDTHNRPISDVQLFIYRADSSIVASGYTDASGAYETNSLLKGKYNVKVVYPNSKTILIIGVPMKPGFTPINLKADLPDADTSMPYTDFLPKPVEKNKRGKKTTTTTNTTTTTTASTTKVAATTAKAVTTTTATAPKKK